MVSIDNKLEYVVVEFVEENGNLGIVPSNWLNGDLSYWPPYVIDVKNKNDAQRGEISTSSWLKDPIPEWTGSGICCRP